MKVEKIVVDKKQARELYREYKAHASYGDKMDKEIQRAYQLIAQGRLVIKALESIGAAGLGPDNRPKLAISNAIAKECHLRLWQAGSASMSAQRWGRGGSAYNFTFPGGTFTVPQFSERTFGTVDAVAQVPLIPINLRPTEALKNYHILFEAEWRPIPPKDPMLLRRIGKADMWLVVAAWDLTEVERAAMATRVSS